MTDHTYLMHEERQAVKAIRLLAEEAGKETQGGEMPAPPRRTYHAAVRDAHAADPASLDDRGRILAAAPTLSWVSKYSQWTDLVIAAGLRPAWTRLEAPPIVEVGMSKTQIDYISAVNDYPAGIPAGRLRTQATLIGPDGQRIGAVTMLDAVGKVTASTDTPIPGWACPPMTVTVRIQEVWSLR